VIRLATAIRRPAEPPIRLRTASDTVLFLPTLTPMAVT